MIRDMTKGNIYNHIVQFSIPIILGNIFQLTYNAVDSIIVGKFAGTKALAAVGTSDPIVNMLILGISGICIGASVLKYMKTLKTNLQLLFLLVWALLLLL